MSKRIGITNLLFLNVYNEMIERTEMNANHEPLHFL